MQFPYSDMVFKFQMQNFLTCYLFFLGKVLKMVD